MEIVIDIDDEITQGIIEGNNDEPRNIVRSFQATIADAIKNGTPLPKGHGDLVDRNDLLEYTDINRSAYIPVINRYEIITAPTVIEADKE